MALRTMVQGRGIGRRSGDSVVAARPGIGRYAIKTRFKVKKIRKNNEKF